MQIPLIKTLACAGAVSLCAASFSLPAIAATVSPLYASGGTLAAFVYYDLSNASLEPNSADSGATCNATTEDCAAELLYAAVGTGSAQASFLAHLGQGSVGSNEPPYLDLVRFPTITSYPYPDLDWAAGDAPLSVTQLTSYNNTLNGTGTDFQRFGAANVVPMMAAPVALAYNPGGTGLPSGTTLQLSRNSFCGIMTGTITNWDDPSIATDNPGVTFNNLAITVVVRSDGSGTTFITSNALNAQCSNFAAVTGGVGIGGSSTNAPVWPSSFVAEHGSGGVQAEINSVAGSIGYLSSNYVQPFAPAGPLAAALQNKANKFVQPTVAAAKLAIRGPFSTVGPCGTAGAVQTCYPAPVTNQILYAPNPTNTGAYPIVGFTYGYFYECSDSTYANTALIGSKGYISGFILKPEVSGVLTAADQIIENDGLVELTNTIKANSKRLLASSTTHLRKGPVAGVCTL